MSERAPTREPGTPASAWLEQVRYEERRGELLAAYDIASRGLEEHPDDVELAYRSVLALARTGATAEAERRYRELGLDGADSDDAAALWARIQKDRSLAASGEARRQLAEMAGSLYEAIADRGAGYFPAINAATMNLVAGRDGDARRLATRSLDLVDASGEDSYYGAATRAEAHLLLGEMSQAERALLHASTLHDGDFGAMSTTRRQLREICVTTGRDTSWLSVLAGPTVAHFCGHTIAPEQGSSGLRRFDEAAAKERIAEAIARRPIGFAYGSLAAGGDILWAEALLSAGAEVHVVLPFATDDFVAVSVAPSGPDWVERFHRCLSRAVDVSYATEGAYLGDEVLFSYCSQIAMGMALLRARYLYSDAVQLALWDGEPPTGPVGTASDIETWRETEHDVVVVSPQIVGGRDPSGPEPATDRRGTRVVRALLMGDMRGFSKLSDEQVLAFSTEVMGAIARALDRFGQAVEYRNTWGDAVIAVLSSAPEAARCALELQESMSAVALEDHGLPGHLALRLSGHIGPVFSLDDPVKGEPTFTGTHISRTARIEPVTPPGVVYVTEAFAAALELADTRELRCDYVGHMPAAKDYGRLRMYHLRRRVTVAR
jgi:hypothetical protein